MNFPDSALKYMDLQCNGDKSLYTTFPELKNTGNYFRSNKPQKVLEIGAGIGRASVFLKNHFDWDETEFNFLDGDEGDVQISGIRTESNEFYNSFKTTVDFCRANDLNNLILWDAKKKDWLKSISGVDLVYSFLALGFHWPIKLYLNDIYEVTTGDALVIFGIRGIEKEAWIKEQIAHIDSNKYEILKVVLEKTSSRESILVLRKKSPKILLIPDVPGWAFDHTADNLIKHLPFSAEKEYASRVTPDHFSNFDRIHFLSWFDSRRFSEFHHSRVSAGVCSHNYELRHLPEFNKRISDFSALIAISKELYDKVSHPNLFYCPNGVDTQKFHPQIPTAFTVGWVGQPTTGGFSVATGFDIKGYELILKPLISELEGEINFRVLDRTHKNAVPYTEMPGWYSQVSCLICTSLLEGCPFPVLEAASSSLAVLSTAVGIVPQVLEKDFYIEPPKKESDVISTIEWFKERLRYLRDNPESCLKEGAKNRVTIENEWSWEKVSKTWIPVFI